MLAKVFFPLRSNASALLQGAPVRSVTDRLKFASLLYEDVMVESGCLMVFVGRESTVILPLVRSAPHNSNWQTPRERASSRGSQIILTHTEEEIRRESSPAIVAWQPTFEPLRPKLPASTASWLHFVESDPPHKASLTEVYRGSKWWDEDVEGELQRKLPDDYVRWVIIKHAKADWASAVNQDAAISMDLLHSLVIESGIAVEERRADAGALVLPILLPHVTSLPWDELSDLRKHSAIADLRQTWQEIGLEVLERSQAEGGPVDTRVHEVYEGRLLRANERVDSIKGQLVTTIVGFVVGEIAGLGATAAAGVPVPLVGGIVGAAASWKVERLAAARRTRPHRWLASDSAIRKAIESHSQASDAERRN